MKEFLTAVERGELRSRHRKEKNRRVADRIKAVLLSDKGWSYRQISEALFLDEQTIGNHVDEYRKSKKLNLFSGGSTSKLGSAEAAELSNHLENQTYLKVSDICAYVNKRYGTQYTTQGMTFWMHSNGFSYKKPKGTPSKADPIKQEAFIKKYRELVRETTDDEPILFGDGVHPTMATKITYGWIKTGKNKPIATTASRTRVNLMGALSLKTMKVTVAEYKSIDSQAMTCYFDLLKTEYPKAKRIHLILDNGPYNVSAITREAAKKHGIIIHYLPTYSPNLNPIERLWKIMNENTRNNKFFASAKEFRTEIMSFFRMRWPEIAPHMKTRINDNFQKLIPTLST